MRRKTKRSDIVRMFYAGKTIELKPVDIFLILYILHHPSYAYQMAKDFKSDKLSVFKSLTKPNKNYPVLNNLQKLGILDRDKTKTRLHGKKLHKRKQYVYYVNPSFISKLVCGNEANEYRYMHYFTELIRSVSPDKSVCLQKLKKITKFDMVTVFVYCKMLVEEIIKYEKHSNNIKNNQRRLELNLKKVPKIRKRPSKFLNLDRLEDVKQKIEEKYGGFPPINFGDMRRTFDEFITMLVIKERMPSES